MPSPLCGERDQKSTPMPLNLTVDDPRLHDWFEANRPLVDLFIQAAERADGISGPEDVDDRRYYPIREPIRARGR